MKHYIIIGSSYEKGRRIGLDITKEKDLELFMKKYQQAPQKYQVSFHAIETEDKSWESVIKKDKFFDKIEILNNFNKFFDLLERNNEITGLDVACYILSREKCCHTKLEKLVYYAYADYLVQTGKQLFKDKVYAFDYGPVIESVYKKFNRKYDLENDKMISMIYKEMPMRSRILVSQDGIDKIYSINKTLDKYCKYSARQLVELTHKDNTPWSMAPKGTYKTINDDLILKYHGFEEV